MLLRCMCGPVIKQISNTKVLCYRLFLGKIVDDEGGEVGAKYRVAK